jgi:hypothetical protein
MVKLTNSHYRCFPYYCWKQILAVWSFYGEARCHWFCRTQQSALHTQCSLTEISVKIYRNRIYIEQQYSQINSIYLRGLFFVYFCQIWQKSNFQFHNTHIQLQCCSCQTRLTIFHFSKATFCSFRISCR